MAKREEGRPRWPRRSSKSAHLHADHQHAGQGQGNLRPLARLRGHGRQPPSGQPGRTPVVDALARRCAKPTRLSHRYYAMKARWLGSTKLNSGTATRRCRKPRETIAWDTARTWCCRPMRALRPRWPTLPAVSSTALDRCTGRPGKSSGAFRPPDGAVGAPLRAGQLPGQAARRDDAGARAWPRRAPGTGGRSGRADGLDPADAGETASVFGEMLTFRALLKETTDPRSARRCWPRRSRTCSTPWCARSRSTSSSARCTSSPGRRTDVRATGRALDRRCSRRAWAGGEFGRLRDVLGLHSALHPLAVLRLCLCVRRLPRELAVLRVYEKPRTVSANAISRCSRRAAPSIIRNCSSSVRTGCIGSRFLEPGSFDDRGNDRRTRSHGRLTCLISLYCNSEVWFSRRYRRRRLQRQFWSE
jgi:hypothetical protein